jgi:hypothetical protein
MNIINEDSKLRNRWLGWQPKSVIFSNMPDTEPSKPSKPSSVGFVASTQAEFQKIAHNETLATPPDVPLPEKQNHGRQKPKTSWTQECLESEKRLGQPHARLFPLLEQEVLIPLGKGILLQVFATRAMVKLPAGVAFVHPEQVRPIEDGTPIEFGKVGNYTDSRKIVEPGLILSKSQREIA